MQIYALHITGSEGCHVLGQSWTSRWSYIEID